MRFTAIQVKKWIQYHGHFQNRIVINKITDEIVLTANLIWGKTLLQYPHSEFWPILSLQFSWQNVITYSTSPFKRYIPSYEKDYFPSKFNKTANIQVSWFVQSQELSLFKLKTYWWQTKQKLRKSNKNNSWKIATFAKFNLCKTRTGIKVINEKLRFENTSLSLKGGRIFRSKWVVKNTYRIFLLYNGIFFQILYIYLLVNV